MTGPLPALETHRPLQPRRPLDAVVDVVIPVCNEEVDLGPSVTRLDAFLSEHFPYPCCITIADNASTDGTWAEAQRLADALPRVRAVHLDQKGRGRALKAVWSDSTAPVLAYMDVDLSTDLRALLPLVAPLISGHSDIAIGSRLARSAQVVRGPKREFISRSYNLILRGALSASFTDAQCGFKAIRADVAADLLPLVEDDNWFFDTELLVIAQRSGLRIHEVPVDWVDDPDSTVDIVATAKEDLAGVARLLKGFAGGRIPVARLRAELGRGSEVPSTVPGVPRGMLGQLVRFGGVGVLSTLAYFLLYLGLREVAGAQAANLVALLVTAVANTAANRRLTFGLAGRAGVLRHHAGGLVAFGVGLGLTSGALYLLHLHGDPSRAVEVVVLVLANALATLVRFLALRQLMGALRQARGAGGGAAQGAGALRQAQGAGEGAGAARGAGPAEWATSTCSGSGSLPGMAAERIELEVEGRTVSISNPQRVYFSARGETKLDLAQYYLSVAPGIVNALYHRPCMLHRFPDGVDGAKVHQKRVPSGAPPWLETVRVHFPRYDRHADELCVAHPADVIWAVQMSTVEFHPWNSRCEDTESPDEWRIDLDPMPEAGYAEVRRTAVVVQELLEELGAVGFPKTSGGKGLHIYVRVVPEHGFTDVRRAALAFAREVERRSDGLVDTTWWRKDRDPASIFLDYNQNARDHTIASAYSVRGTPEGRVSAPLRWDEIADAEPGDFTIATMPARYAATGDLHATIDEHPYRLDTLLEWAARDERDGAEAPPED